MVLLDLDQDLLAFYLVLLQKELGQNVSFISISSIFLENNHKK